MTMLEHLIPAAEEGWHVLLDLAEHDSESWLLVGGQMMFLLAAEHSVTLPRPTADMDVVVDVRARPRGTEWLAAWLIEQGFVLDGTSPDGIGHRFVREADRGRGTVQFDVLGPEGVGSRANLLTLPPARTVQAPGSAQAFHRSSVVPVTVSGTSGRRPRSGQVRRPDVLGALVAKAAATQIAARQHPERDWQDAALLLSLLVDPLAAAETCTKKDRQRLRLLEPLSDPGHRGWAVFEDDSAHRRGTTTLAFLLDR
jgi:hypothetical protein